jgi:hypothetical protein
MQANGDSGGAGTALAQQDTDVGVSENELLNSRWRLDSFLGAATSKEKMFGERVYSALRLRSDGQTRTFD